MAFFIQMLIYWCVLWIISQFAFKEKLSDHAFKGRLAFSTGFLLVGVMHLINPHELTYMVEDFLPYPRLWVIFTGIIEIGLAILLHFKAWQKTVGWIIILYLGAVFPANINVAINGLNAPGGLPSTPLYLWSRLFFQPVYMLWVYFSAISPASSPRQTST